MKKSLLAASFAILLAFHIPSLADEGKDESGKGRERKEYRADKDSWKHEYKGRDDYGKKRIERSTTRIKIPESITLTTLISTDGMASVPIYTTMDIAVSIFLQGIILLLVNAVYGIRIDLQGINHHLSGAVIRYQEARG